jgi:hypothetical protein
LGDASRIQQRLKGGTMLTYNSDEQFKKDFTAIVVQHRKDDAVAQGTYGTQNGHWKGCAVACSLRSYDLLKGKKTKVEYNDHSRFEKVGLWPEWLARLEDEIFEHLPPAEAQTWPERVAKAVPVGVNITPVKWKFCAFLMKENIERVLLLDIPDALKGQVVSAIRQVLAVHTSVIQSGEWDAAAAESAESAAWSAAESAAESAARSAARSAAWSAARSAAESAAWDKFANHLVELFESY